MPTLRCDRAPSPDDVDRAVVAFQDGEIISLSGRFEVATARAGKLRLADWAMGNLDDPDGVVIEEDQDDQFPLVIVRVCNDVYLKSIIRIGGAA